MQSRVSPITIITSFSVLSTVGMTIKKIQSYYQLFPNKGSIFESFKASFHLRTSMSICNICICNTAQLSNTPCQEMFLTKGTYYHYASASADVGLYLSLCLCDIINQPLLLKYKI